MVHLPDDLRQEIIDHCAAALPNEGCGMLAMDDDEVVKVYPTANDDASPSSYTVPPQEHFDAMTDAESKGWRLGGVFHSHPGGPARMSAVDLENAREPDWVYLVVGLGGPKPELRGWCSGVELEI
ncbi:MAG: Mov34/MPN/PAD-1 family protein [Acidimicrobiia bacterium]